MTILARHCHFIIRLSMGSSCTGETRVPPESLEDFNNERGNVRMT
jgi:hypothetical protein